MTPDLSTTNTWLAILAIASALQTAMLIFAALALFRVYRKTTEAVERLEERHLAPISARMTLMMDDLQDMTARARRVDDVVREKISGVENVVREAGHLVGGRLWPVIGAARAVREGLRAFSQKSPAPPITVAARANREATL
jgi:hypothetical protein